MTSNTHFAGLEGHWSCHGCKHEFLESTKEPCYSCRNGLCVENLNRKDNWEPRE